MISLCVAFDPNKGIGNKGVMPWHIKEEFKVFRANTMFKKIIMGKTTYINLPGKLKDREMYVVTRDKSFKDNEVTIISDLEHFCKEHQNDETEYIICGGASIYKQAYPYCQQAYVSFIKNSYEVDTYFDSFSLKDWNIVEEVEYDEFIYRKLTRKNS